MQIKLQCYLKMDFLAQRLQISGVLSCYLKIWVCRLNNFRFFDLLPQMQYQFRFMVAFFHVDLYNQ